MSDIIAAISTALAPSGIGVIRLSGPGCARAAEPVLRPLSGIPFSEAPNRKLILADLLDRQDRVMDRILAVYTRGPHSYTGEDTVELQCHGSPTVLTEALLHLFSHGIRQAEAGEFTKRAFLNGRMDLTAAEAVIDLIEAETADAAANAAGQVSGALRQKLEPIYDSLTGIMSHFHAVLDYPDEDIDDFSLQSYAALLEEQKSAIQKLLSAGERGQVVRNGVRAVLLGRPNVGKSSLLNALAGYDRVIVTDIPGTTRDTVEEKLQVGGLLLRLTDTAGIREAGDPVERLGVRRAVEAAGNADLALLVLDGSAPLTEEDRQAMEAARQARHTVCVLSKGDLPQVLTPADTGFSQTVSVSAKTGAGLETLSNMMGELFALDVPCDGTLLTNSRHISALTRAADAISRAQAAMEWGQTPDAVLVDVEEAMEAMGEVTGKIVREDITAGIFSRFCVGK